MVQHGKLTEDLNKAMNDIETAYKKYTDSVDKALKIAGYSYGNRQPHLLEMLEHKEMIISMCNRKRNIR